MIVITVDGLNWKYAQEYYKDVFKKQSMKMIRCQVRPFAMQGANGTPIGLACLWSGEKIKNFHPSLYSKFEDKYKSESLQWLDKDGKPLDLIWNYFSNPKFYEKVCGDSPYYGEQYWKFYHNLPVKRVPCEELCVFVETYRKDYDLFWIHSSIVKTGTLSIGPYELGRHPSIIPYDEIRKNKQLKHDVYVLAIRRYKEVIKYLEEISGNQTIIVTADHGTLTDIPFTDEQIDEIPLIVNRDVDLTDINFQWDVKKLILRLKDAENI